MILLEPEAVYGLTLKPPVAEDKPLSRLDIVAVEASVHLRPPGISRFWRRRSYEKRTSMRLCLVLENSLCHDTSISSSAFLASGLPLLEQAETTSPLLENSSPPRMRGSAASN